MPIFLSSHRLLPAIKLALLIVFALADSTVHALTITPSKLEFTLTPGGRARGAVEVINDGNQSQRVLVRTGDLKPDANPESVIGVSEANSLIHSYLKVTETNFLLGPWQKRQVDFEINLPQNISLGGLAGSLIFTFEDDSTQDTKFVSRVGALILIRIEGLMQPEAQVINFALANNKHLVWRAPPPLQIKFANSGNVYLNPYGQVRLRSWRREQVFQIDPWFVLPQGTRVRSVPLPHLPVGWYRAQLVQNRGYNNIVDERSWWFLVITPNFLLAILIVLGLIIGGFVLRLFR